MGLRFSTSATLSLVLVSGIAGAQETTIPDDRTRQLSPEECALIENGIRRLACYDQVLDPARARAEATPDKVRKIEGKAAFTFSGRFVGYRPTYVLPISWVKSPNPRPTSPSLGTASYDYDLEREEAKYQISFKVPLFTGMLDDRTSLWFGYTQKSFWQLYNRDDSAPFRETNYEPEIFMRYQTDLKLGKGTLNALTLGFNHQSNGQSEPRSRSWNRIIASAAYRYDRWLFIIQPWYRIPENSENDNPDIERYLGYANYTTVYKLSEDRTLSLNLMNNMRSDSKTSVEFGYSFPMGNTVKGFFQYYNGYGESLIDYNHRIERFGIGIMLNDWL